MPYVGSSEDAKVPRAGAAISGLETSSAVIFAGLLMATILPPASAALCVSGAALAALLPALAAQRLIGGHTGDVLGAVEQIFEAAFIIAASLVLVNVR